jgi:hypothetical protein
MQEGGQRRQKKRQQTKWIGKKAHTKKYIIRTAHRTGDGRNGNTHCMTMEKGLLRLKAAANEASPNNDSRQGGLARMIQHAVR